MTPAPPELTHLLTAPKSPPRITVVSMSENFFISRLQFTTTHDEKMRCTLLAKRRHRGDGLHRFSKSHLVAEQNLFLSENVFCPELLIASQRCFEIAKLQRVAVHRLRKLTRQTRTAVFNSRRRALVDFFKLCVIVCRARLEVRPARIVTGYRKSYLTRNLKNL